MEQHFELIRAENHCHLDRFYDFAHTLKATIDQMNIELKASANCHEPGEIREGSESHTNLKLFVSDLEVAANDIDAERPTEPIQPNIIHPILARTLREHLNEVA